jgi:hypothetical protein
MIRAKFVRTHQDASCTRGSISVAGQWVCHTLELPWRDNDRSVSCIPAGVYPCEWTLTYAIPRARVRDVPGRVGIQIHVGNSTREISGCILAGMAWAGRNLVHSKMAMLELYKATKCAPFELEVVDVQTPVVQ